MIRSVSYEKAWLDSHRQRPGHERINPPLAEKMIHALSLVDQLAALGLNFVFKGGTSLLLLLDDAGRFSIDIDIITQVSRGEIENVLTAICGQQPFHRFELSEHRSYKAGIPKAHYNLYYSSVLSGKEEYILLDILFEIHAYPSLLQRPVRTPWLLTEEEYVLVNVPSAASLAGDKLTAFAPTTSGILYRTGREVEIVKQLYDVNRLYSSIESVETFINAFNGTVEKELRYRGDQHTKDDVLTDILDVGLMLAKRERNKTEPHKAYFAEMQRGLLAFKSFQTTGAFRIEEATIAGAKAALLAAKIRTGNTDPLPQFAPGMQKSELLVQHSAYMDVNRLQPEALFYWHHALKLLFL